MLFFGDDVDPQDAAPFQSIGDVEIVTSPQMNGMRRNASLLRSLVLGSDPATRRMFNEHRIDVVFENAQFYGWRLGIPAIAWFPDLQHRELPHLFPRAAWWKREIGFRAQIAAGRAIMLSSNDSRAACERYYPATAGRTHVIRFAVPSEHRPNTDEVRRVRELYDLPERYFYLPSQFWRHKNHLLVIEALSLLKERYPEIVVVASGNQRDPHQPDYFQRVLSGLAAANLKQQFRLLGLIPYEHIAPVMVGGIALLNPSLFEGWSTTVEEARALKVPMVLSDLPVHKEQALGIARFFDRTSATALADALGQAWQQPSPLAAGIVAVPKSSADPVKRFANDFVDLVQHVAGRRP
ncbi:MAG: glycosyltransferase family 1 protein [Alphaproteobacteria bacterium]|nr:glycosyltransferase family 1 protein [Alphaproteobacteria bacterium]